VTYFSTILKSDMLKIKRTMIKRIHIIVPLLGIALFLSYYSFAEYNSVSKVALYLQVLGVSFPLLISIVASMCIEQESLSGNFIEILIGSKIKILSFISKLVLLIGLGFLAILVACMGFFLGMNYGLGEKTFNISFYLIAALILIGSNIFEYIFHLFLSMKYSKSVSIGVGITQSLISALLLTGLGENIWSYIPSSWGSRLVNNFIIFTSNPSSINGNLKEIYIAIGMCFILTIMSLVISCIWFYNWEGRGFRD